MNFDDKTWKMLSDREKEGCKTILKKLTQQDLVTLTDTVTNRVVTPENTRGKYIINCIAVLCSNFVAFIHTIGLFVNLLMCYDVFNGFWFSFPMQTPERSFCTSLN